MASKFQRMGKLALPVILMSLMAGCATTSDLEKVQKEVDELKAATNKATATAESASATSQEAKSLASDASGFSAAAVKGSEAAVQVAVQAKQSVSQSTIAIPWMRLDPATGQFYMQWIVWPSIGEYITPQATSPSAPKQ